MSELIRVSYVVEGKTDFTVLDALVEHFLGNQDYLSNQIQPPSSDYAGDHGPLGGGWKGVLHWCDSQGEEATPLGGFTNSLAMRNCDCLIIHIDADIAGEADLRDLQLGNAAAPAQTCDNIRNLIAALLEGAPPAKLIICIPAQCTEAWVFVALHTSEVAGYAPIEQRPEVERLLIGRRERLVRNKGGAAQKINERYIAAVPRIVQNWPEVTSRCTQAALFESAFRAVFS